MGVRQPKDLEATPDANVENESFLEDPESEFNLTSQTSSLHKARFSYLHIFGTFLLVILVHSLFLRCLPLPETSLRKSLVSRSTDAELASPYAGSTEVDQYPPTHPTNTDSALFPSNVGFAGPTFTGAQPALLVTAPAYPIHSGAQGLVVPPPLHSKPRKGFQMLRKWGNLSPWYSNEKGAFGVDSDPEVPEGYRVKGLHLLHRHGARYPTSGRGGPSAFAMKLHNDTESWTANGRLSFLNEWTYKLGSEVLTPFGRQQLFDLGISTRLKYGFLLKNFTESNILPVFRTESQDRMVASAMNFAIGFFGYPFDGMYQQSITYEGPGFNNTLAPYFTCPNAQNATKAFRGSWYTNKWNAKYLKTARHRLNSHIDGIEFTIEDVYAMQETCAYETVALGYSKFCELFTKDEWDGFDYSLDLTFWYGSAFGSPLARAQGIGYIQELVARLTQTPIETHNSSTNCTLDDDKITFPLDGRSLYVDATHEVVILNVLTALNLSSLASNGPLPPYKIPKRHQSFFASRLAPFASNIQFQLLSSDAAPESTQIRVIVNDGVVPLSSIKGCPWDKEYGMCPVDVFVEGMKEIIAETDWEWSCHGNWTVPEGDKWHTVTGSPPSKAEWEVSHST